MKNENTIFIEAYPDIYLAVAEYFENRELKDDYFNKYAIDFIKRLAYLQRTEQCAEKWIDYINRTYGTATDEFNAFVYCVINITAKDSVLHNRLEKDIYYTQPKHFIKILNKYKDIERQPLPQLVFKFEESQKDEPIYAEPSPLYRHKGIVYDLTKCTQDDLEYLYLIVGSEKIYCEVKTTKADECIEPKTTNSFFSKIEFSGAADCIEMKTTNNPFEQTILAAFQYINGHYDFDKNTYLIKQYLKRKANEAKQQGYEYKEFLLKSIEFVEALKFQIYAIAALKKNSIADSDKPMPEEKKERLIQLLKDAKKLISDAKDIEDTANEILGITINLKIEVIIFTIKFDRQRIPYSQIRLVFLALKELEKELSKPPASTETNVKRFDYANHIDKITKIFDILHNNINTDLPTFLHCVGTADFSSIYIERQKKSVRLAIKHIKDLMSKEWYDQAANNINTKERVISGTADEPTEELLRKITKKPKRSYNK